MNGEIPSEISIMTPSTQLIGLALFANSLMMQRKILKSEEIDTEEKELSKAIEERKAIENDSLGSRRYFEPDILTQAVIEERSYKHTNAYNLNLNKRQISREKIIVKLTEREINLILFLKKNSSAVKINELQKEVWSYGSKLDTHTVETHIYRLRKKIKDKFDDDKFILSSKEGYLIN